MNIVVVEILLVFALSFISLVDVKRQALCLQGTKMPSNICVGRHQKQSLSLRIMDCHFHELKMEEYTSVHLVVRA